jgi:hypothetical protein
MPVAPATSSFERRFSLPSLEAGSSSRVVTGGERRLSLPTQEGNARNSLPAVPVFGERRNSLSGFQPLTSVGVSDADVYSRIDNDPNAVRVKGINFIALLEAVSKCHGAAARLELEKRLIGEVGDALRFGGIVAGGWYKVTWYRILWRTTTDLLVLDEAGARRLSHKATAYSVNIVYRTLAKLANPAVLIDACARVYATYFDKGQLVVLSSQTGQVVVEWTRCNGFDVLLWNHVVASSVFFLESSGATAVQGNVLGGGGGQQLVARGVRVPVKAYFFPF